MGAVAASAGLAEILKHQCPSTFNTWTSNILYVVLHAMQEKGFSMSPYKECF